MLVGTGSFDTIIVNSPGVDLHDIRIEHLYLIENSKTGGNAIVVQRVSRCSVSDRLIQAPAAGVRLHNVNTVEFERIRMVTPTASNSYGFWITGTDAERTDVVTFKNVVVQGTAGAFHSTHGLIVDGNVNTLSAYKLYLNQMDGAGLWFRNTMGSANPEFATFYGLEIEGPFLEAVNISVGTRFYFTDAHRQQVRRFRSARPEPRHQHPRGRRPVRGRR